MRQLPCVPHGHPHQLVERGGEQLVVQQLVGGEQLVVLVLESLVELEVILQQLVSFEQLVQQQPLFVVIVEEQLVVIVVVFVAEGDVKRRQSALGERALPIVSAPYPWGALPDSDGIRDVPPVLKRSQARYAIAPRTCVRAITASQPIR